MKHAVVVGAGHNGLVCAAYLVRAGWKVTVLEKRDVIGGCAVTESPWPGYRVSTAAYLVSLFKNEIIRDLDLHRFGFHVYPKDPPFFTPFPDGDHLFMWQDTKKTQAEFARFSRHDADALPAYDAYLESLAQQMDPMNPVETPGLRELLELSAEEFLSRWFQSDRIKATLATDGVIGASGGPRAKGSAYVLLHHCMGLAAGRRGLWGFVRGGMGALSNAIAQSSGANIRTNATVTQMSGNAVQLETGERIEADAVISNLHPKRTVPNRYPNYVSQGVSLKMNLALSGLPHFLNRPAGEGPEHRATIHICPSLLYMQQAWQDCAAGRPSREPLIEMGLPTVYDDSLAPRGHHLASLFVQYIPYDTSDAERDRFAEIVIDTVERYAPGFRNLIVHRQVLAPRDLEQRFGLEGGNIFHGDLIASQLFSRRPSPVTEVPGLFLCGSGTNPGGGVMGSPGYNAAQAVIDAHTTTTNLRSQPPQ